LIQAREFVLEAWRNKNGWTVLEEPYKQHQAGPTFKWNNEKGEPRHFHPTITRARIRELLEETKDRKFVRNEFYFYKALMEILSKQYPKRYGKLLPPHYAFSELTDLLMAFYLAYKEGRG